MVGPDDAEVTVTAVAPLLPSLVAVTLAEPTATPVTSPLPFTVATPVASLDQLTDLPLNALSSASFKVAASCTVVPTWTEAGFGATVTVATGVWEPVESPPPQLVAAMVATTESTVPASDRKAAIRRSTNGRITGSLPEGESSWTSRRLDGMTVELRCSPLSEGARPQPPR